MILQSSQDYQSTQRKEKLENVCEDSETDESNTSLQNENEKLCSGENEREERSCWADAMAKVLNMGKTLEAGSSEPRKLLLSKAKKDCQIEKLRNKNRDQETDTSNKKKSLGDRRLQRDSESLCRSKPSILFDKAKERKLNKLATKGVVRLFNAVREQQRDLKNKLEEAGTSTRRREKVFANIDKDGFLQNVLGVKDKRQDESHFLKKKYNRDDEEENGREETMDIDDSESEQSSWNVLRNDFMMGAKLKDWDKNSESD